MTDKTLKLNFSGRVIDHLGIQMYQSPTAAIAEMVSNAWDADAKRVNVGLPNEDAGSGEDFEIVISDNGHGMTFQECQDNYLTVGFDRREGDAKATSRGGRPLMGRKGIGKFAGFGIASQIDVRTISELTGELTAFTLDLAEIRSGGKYINANGLSIVPHTVEGPNEERKASHGTTLTLRRLKLNRKISVGQFMRSMARRFMVNNVVDEFSINVNETPIPEDEDLTDVEYSFPEDYEEDQKPINMQSIEDGWGVETIGSGHTIRWRILFKKDTIKEEGLQGIAIFAHKKLAQKPCMFNITGGLTSQTGPEYMAGSVIANFVDELSEDVISTERQRLNWEHADLRALEIWGQARIRQLLGIWKERRGAEKMRLLNEKIDGFRDRLDSLGYDSKTVEAALKRLASVEKISAEQYRELGGAILTAWEGGRLKHLIRVMSTTDEMDESSLLKLLIEADTIQALHTAESVKAKLEAIKGLERRINERQIENAVRDYISKHPWLISPEWETFAVEKNVHHIVREAHEATKNAPPPSGEEPFTGRVDLVLSSGHQLLVMEFMRPGLKIDHDHVARFENYINTIRERIEVAPALGFKHVSGYLVADKFLSSDAAMVRKLKRLNEDQMYPLQWVDLLARAKDQWKEFLDHLVERAPEDPRMIAVKADIVKEELLESVEAIVSVK
ncbi:ATP-binding protein [Paraburkholderia sediminicola]|uniref:ATP-binding protein n=1 Tax=Paraburkholderia rhynchosiae TaxID=487049 RepID=A0ACC7NAG9_9BURK